MIKIRLARKGKKNNPFYQIVVIDDSKKRGGKSVKRLGYWDAYKNKLQINKEEISFWLSKGAQLTRAVEELLSKNG